ncbi:MAG: GEVED domain-containing protein [Thiofilum sp.]|uniref:lectin-like domain-containing protein n=1 Tax=Thiofilum sp. TaxID=2212733 RepID=UPI0025EEA1E6|nr:GEVED domain-containing protein [Thiofilum sp.]
MQNKWSHSVGRFANLLFLFSILVLWSSTSYAERVTLLNSATSSASGSGSAGMASLTGFNIPTGDNRALMIVVAFERDHCDKATDNCTSTNTGATGDLADNFAYDSGHYNSSNVHVTARVQAGTNTITKKNALLLSGAPSGDLRFTLNRKELRNASNVVIANTTYFSLETYTIVFYESELKTLLNGASSGLVDIAFPTVPLPKSTGDDMIVAAYVFDNVKQNNRGIVRANAGVYTPTTGAIAGNYTLTTPNFDAGDTLVHMNDYFMVVGVSSLGYPASKGGFTLINSYYREIHTATTTNNQGRFDTVFSTGSQEPDGMSLTTQRYNANYDGLGTNYAIQSAGLSTDRLNALNVASYVIYSHNRDTSDAQEDYPIAQHDVVGVRLGNLVDEDWVSYLGYNPRARADDLDGVDDEDGVTFPATITPNSTITAAVNVQNGSGYLNAWIDWNRDADFDDVGERLATEMPINTGVVNLSITVPALVPPETFARFRVCSALGQCNTPAGIATSGEVEDHVVSFNDPKSLPNVAGTTAGACSPTGGADVLFVLDNSGSIDLMEYANFASNVVNVGNQLLASNSETRIAVAHYGGVYRSNEFGQHVYFERDFSKANVVNPIRQFGPLGLAMPNLVMDNLAGAVLQMMYGLDNNPATDSVFILSSLRSLNRDLSKPLQIVIFTDAWRYADYGSALIDGAGFAFEPDDGSSFTIFNKLKAQGIKFTVVLYPDNEPTALPAAAAIASKGGSYNGTVEANTADPEGSGTPRRLVEATTSFTLTPAQIGDIAGVIANTCPAAPNNPPVITSNGGADTAALSITENTRMVTTVTATDADNDALTYSLNGGADAAKFTINASTGLLEFITAPSADSPTDVGGDNYYEVQVRVSDGRGGTDTQALSIRVVKVVNVLPPIMATQVCPANPQDLGYSDYRVRWTYNTPPNTLEADHVDTTVLASANAQVIGSGLTYSFEPSATTVIHLAGVNQSNVASAFNNGDYIEYRFSTLTTMPANQLLNGLGFQIHNLGQSYKFSVMVSKDNFATAKTLLNDYSVNPSAVGFYQLAFVEPMYLEANTAYQLRVVFHSAADASNVYWDDLHLSMGLCQDFGDAPASYGSAPHGLVPAMSLYLGAVAPDAEADALVSNNAQGDNQAGLRPNDEEGITLPNTIIAKQSTYEVRVVGSGYLQAWIDWNTNGVFEASEQIATNLADSDNNGLITLAINAPNAVSNLTTFMRLRWANQLNVNANMPVLQGEVEDYLVNFQITNNAPVITSNGGGDNAYLSITENTTVVTTVTATDADNDVLTYSLNGGADASKFTINASTGVLAFTSAPSFNNPQDVGGNNIYEVRVQVSDNRGGVDNQLVSVAVLESQVCLPIPATSVVNASISAANEYILTQSLQGQRGALWGNNRINLNASFDYRAKVYLGNDSTGADGMTFTLQPLGNNVIGQAGRGLGSGDGGDGASGKGLDPSLVIELDTHTNLEPNWYDPAQDHLAIYSNGNTRHNGAATDLVSPISLGNISDGRYHDFRVVWNAATKTLQVYFDNTLQATKVVDLVSILGTATPYWGYTASTGARFNLHKVCNKTDPSIPSNYPPIITSNGGGDTAAISINENTTAVTTVTATDADNDTLSYSISGGADAAKFTLNASTGVLQFITAPDFESPNDADGNNSYIVRVKVVDGKGGEDQQTLTVSVLDQVDIVGVRVRAFLQGPYDAEQVLMQDNLRSTNLIPLTQPYKTQPFNYQGTETVSTTRLAVTGVTALVDWVLIELRSAANPNTVVARKAALLTRSGDVINPASDQTLLSFDGVDSSQSYYVAVVHRNHLAVMSSNTFNLGLANAVLIDFTAPTTSTHGGLNARLTHGIVSLMWAGDANRSQFVIANGPDNDPMSVLNAALLASGNTFLNSNYIVNGYSSNDLDLNGYSLFSGPNNDLNIVIGNVLMHGANATRSSNYVIQSGVAR